MTQKKMKASMSGPKIRHEIDAMAEMTREDRNAYMLAMTTAKLAIVAEVITNHGGKTDHIIQVIVWEMPDSSGTIEIQTRRKER